MPNKYSQMDQWSDEEVAFFKEDAASEGDQSTTIFDGPVGAAPISTRSKLTVVSEGDSWFDYKIGTDLIDCLRRFHGYRIKNFATPGDTLENMIYGTQVNRNYERVSPQISVVLKRLKKDQPEVFLFSGGGNDIAGDEFISFLHHADSNLGVLKNNFALSTINTNFRKYYQDLISKVLSVSSKTHIFVHGYGYARPSGKGAGVLGIQFVGPWLRPALGKKGITPETEGKRAIEELIDLYNDMLQALDNENPNFHYVDLRAIIEDSDWRDELHLQSSAFRLVSDEIDAAINMAFPR